MKTLFDICLSFVGRHLDQVGEIDHLPLKCKEWLLDYLSSHDRLSSKEASLLVGSAVFLSSIRQVNFYLSDQLTDDMLWAIGQANRQLQQVTIVHCSEVTNRGIRGITVGQKNLFKLELRGLKTITSYGIAGVESTALKVVDLSECPAVCSSGIIHLVTHNPSIQRLSLNGCTSVDDIAIYAIGSHLNSSLLALDLDFMVNLADPASAISYLTERCPNLLSLSLCRYFEPLLSSDLDYLNIDCRIQGERLKEIDLYGNYFAVLPSLPRSVVSIRLTCSGWENVEVLAESLQQLPNLASIRLILNCRDTNEMAVARANSFLEFFALNFGAKLTALQIMAYRMRDGTIRRILENCPHIVDLAVDVGSVSSYLLLRFFSETDRSGRLRSLKFSRMRLTNRILTQIAVLCGNLEEIEMSFMPCVDDKFLKLIAQNCPKLKKVNFSGCLWVTDRGLCELASRCPLREIRIRATGVTDKCVYALAQSCPDLEWIAHADYTGKPKFSQAALQQLKDCCNSRVIC